MQWDLHDSLAIAHALVACIAVLITMPIALLSGRYLRGSPRWFKIHVVFNTVTTVLIVIVFGLGMGAVGSQGAGTSFSGPNADLHHQIGLMMFIATLLQSVIGFTAHNFPARHISRRVHVGFGLLVAAGLYWVVWEGLHDEWPEMNDAMTTMPQSVQILFWVFFLIPLVAWGAAVGQKALNAVAAKGFDETSISEKMDSPSPVLQSLS